MGIQGFPNGFPSPQTPIIDPETGAFTKDGRYFLLALWNRTGQGPGLPTVAAGLAVLAGIPFGITTDWSQFGAVAAGGIAVIPAISVGADAVVFNGGANSLLVKPQPTAQIDALGLGAGYPLAAGKMQWFRCVTPTQLNSMQLG